MKFHNVLVEVLGNKTKVRLLNAFFTYPLKEFSEMELQRICGIPQPSAHRNLGYLGENGILDRRYVGKANQYSLNKKHILTAILGKIFKEENLLARLKNEVAAEVKRLPDVDVAVLFGSVAKGTERADSDIDIFIACKKDKSGVEGKLKRLEHTIENKFGNPLSLMIKSEEELKELKTKAIYDEIKNGEIIFKREAFEW